MELLNSTMLQTNGQNRSLIGCASNNIISIGIIVLTHITANGPYMVMQNDVNNLCVITVVIIVL